jgi:hypothetical protein
MPARPGVCTECGGPTKSEKSKRCRGCWYIWWTARDSRPRCVDCGVVIGPSQERKRCWECHTRRLAEEKAARQPTCERCGGPVATKSTRICIDCVRADRDERLQARVCIDCGAPVTGFKAERCRDCYARQMHEDAATYICSVEGCGKKAKASGLCPNHYRAAVRGTNDRRRTWGFKAWVCSLPCAVCGYDRMRSQPHRPDPPKGYVVNNIVPLCARCHGEVEAGITPCPPPPDASRYIPLSIKLRGS